jgi:tetratricopeptide (TPR) repeat protein
VDPRRRTYLVVALASAGAAALVVATVAFTRTSTGTSRPAESTARAPRRAPALALDLGLRTDPEARALGRANRLYAAGKRRAAGRIFARYPSLPARVGAACAAWPRGTVARLERLADAHPASALVLLHLGLARVSAGQTQAAEAAWRQALARDPDTESAVQAESLLYPGYAPGLPPFVTSFATPRELERLSAARQLAALRRGARRDDIRAKLLYGAALQRLGRRVSAEREFAAAARLAPADAEAQTARAVGLFSKVEPARAFSRLGPLTRRFPHAQTVRFHLGELLLWLGQLREARRELRLARAEGAATPLGKTAGEFLARLPT